MKIVSSMCSFFVLIVIALNIMVKGKKGGGIFSALGAATGLGNALRFPSLCAHYGGAFVFAYALCLVYVCFPLLCAELELGKNKSLDKNGRRFWIIKCAAVNSAIVALYYGVIGAKIGGAFFSFCAAGVAGEAKGTALFALCALFVFAVWFVLAKRGRIARLGKISVTSSLTLMTVLVFAALIKGGSLSRVFRFEFSSLASGGLWIDALAQGLISLSLAGGVMPAFAGTFEKRFNVCGAAARIIAANFCACLLAATAALCLPVGVSEKGGVTAALTLYPQIIVCSFANAFVRRAFGASFFGSLCAVAVQSACSLFSPAAELITGRSRKLTVAMLCGLSLVLAPLFFSYGGAVFHAVDRMACSVNAVIIAFAECIFYVCPRNMPKLSKNLKNFCSFSARSICTAACGALALFSLCGARFSVFPAAAATIAALALSAAFTPAAINIYRTISHKKI